MKITGYETVKDNIVLFMGWDTCGNSKVAVKYEAFANTISEALELCREIGGKRCKIKGFEDHIVFQTSNFRHEISPYMV